jgi:hypothetical protein
MQDLAHVAGTSTARQDGPLEDPLKPASPRSREARPLERDGARPREACTLERAPSRIATVDLIDEITVTADPILAMTIGIDVIIAAITAAMTDAMTTVVMTALISTIEVIVVMIAMTIATTTGATINVARTTTTAKTTIARSGHLRHHPKGATLMVHSRRPTARSTSSLVVAKRSKPTGKLDRTPERSGTSTLKIHDLYAGLNSQSPSLGRIIGFTSPTPEPIRWSLTP